MKGLEADHVFEKFENVSLSTVGQLAETYESAIYYEFRLVRTHSHLAELSIQTKYNQLSLDGSSIPTGRL